MLEPYGFLNGNSCFRAFKSDRGESPEKGLVASCAPKETQRHLALGFLTSREQLQPHSLLTFNHLS